IRTFRANLDIVLKVIKLSLEQSQKAVARVIKYNYSSRDPNKPSIPYLTDVPGLMDTHGAGQAGLSLVIPDDNDPKVRFFFSGHGVKHDIPAAWEQDQIKANHWLGFLKNNFFRNVVAALGVVGSPYNIDPNIS